MVHRQQHWFSIYWGQTLRIIVLWNAIIVGMQQQFESPPDIGTSLGGTIISSFQISCSQYISSHSTDLPIPGYHGYRHYIDVIMTTMASQIASLTVVYSTVYSDADQRKHQSSASLAFVWGTHRDRWIPRTKGQLRGNVSIWWRHHGTRRSGQTNRCFVPHGDTELCSMSRMLIWERRLPNITNDESVSHSLCIFDYVNGPETGSQCHR